MSAVVAGVLAVPSPASAKPEKAQICHWDADSARFKVISVSENAVRAHFGNHGDTQLGDYWADADGDGFGDPNGVYDVCPQIGLVDNALDCDDSDITVHPDAEEVCGDDIDNNCSGAAEEGCTSGCPCYTAADIDVANDAYLAGAPSMDFARQQCTDQDTAQGYSSASVLFYQYGWSGSEFNYALWQFASFGNGGSSQCTTYEYRLRMDSATGDRTIETVLDTLPISSEERQACEDIALGWAQEAGLVCLGS